MTSGILETNKVYVVLRDRKAREFRRAFSSLDAARGYIKTGQTVGICGSDKEFVELHDIRDS